MSSIDPTPSKGVPFSSVRHRVDAPEVYENWRDYAFSSESEVQEPPIAKD